MQAGALNFTLGLQANQFVNGLGISTGRLLTFLGAAGSVGAALDKMWESVKKGGQFTDLAASASLTVKDLYQLRRGFEDVGAAADNVPTIINKLRRTLATGEQDNLLRSMGLDPESLSKNSPARQFEMIDAAMTKLNVNARSQAASALFGREGARIGLQIANSGNAFADAMQRAAADAGIWDKVSNAFDQISDKVAEIQAHIETMWALLAGSLVQAFQEGKLAEVITDIIVTGFKAGLAIVPGLFAKLGEVLLRVFETPLVYLQAGIEYAIDQAVNNPKMRALVGAMPGGGALIAGMDASGVTSGKPSSFQEIFDARRAEGLRFNFGTGEFGMSDISSAANRTLDKGYENAQGLLGGLRDRLGEIVGRLPKGNGASAGAATGGGILGKTNASDFTNLEKMGGVFNGLGRGFGGDDARQTANNTGRMAKTLERIENKLSSGSGSDLVNE